MAPLSRSDVVGLFHPLCAMLSLEDLAEPCARRKSYLETVTPLCSA